MRAILQFSVAIVAAASIAGCGPSYQGSYPSYEAVISQYVPAGAYEGVKLEDAAYYPPGSYCDCPRVWYEDHWVYYYHGRWIYWYHDCWYHYPVFYVYYWGGVPYVYSGPVKSIHKANQSTAAGGSPIHHAYPPARPAARSFGGSSSKRSSPPPRQDRDTTPSSNRKGGRR